MNANSSNQTATAKTAKTSGTIFIRDCPQNLSAEEIRFCHAAVLKFYKGLYSGVDFQNLPIGSVQVAIRYAGHSGSSELFQKLLAMMRGCSFRLVVAA